MTQPPPKHDGSPEAQLEALFAAHPYCLHDVEAMLIDAAIARQKGCVTAAAKELGIGRTTVYRHFKRRQAGQR